MLQSNKKGVYTASPMLGTAIFLIVVAVAASIVNEDRQQVVVASTGIAKDNILFIAQAVSADAFNVLNQNSLQHITETYSLYELDQNGDEIDQNGDGIIDTYDVIPLNTQYRNMLYENLDTGISVYSYAYNITYKVICVPYPTEIVQRVYTKGKDYGGPPIDIAAGELEIRATLVGYNLQCTSKEPPVTIKIILYGRWYLLDARHIDCLIYGQYC